MRLQSTSIVNLERETMTTTEKQTHVHELITKASHSMMFACGDLPIAYSMADPVMAIILLQMCERANTLKRDIEALLEALEALESAVEVA